MTFHHAIRPLIICSAIVFLPSFVWAEDAKTNTPAVSQKTQIDQPEFAGSIFGQPLPTGNYYFVIKTVTTFGTPWGGIPENQKQLEKRVKDDLLLSFEAFRRNISVTQEELDDEMTKTLKGHKVEFDWKADKDAYAKWTKDTLGESTELFENQLRHLVQLRKLQKEIMDGITPAITDDQAFQEFLNEYNTLSVELVQFDDPQDADKFYKKAVSNKKFWDKEKGKTPDKFKRPGFVALEFLMYMWQFPKDDVYKMLEKKVGDIYPPTPIYRGKGVFKILEIRKADEKEFPRLKDSYYDQLRTQKKYEGFNKWLEDLHKEASIRLDIPLPQMFPADNKT